MDIRNKNELRRRIDAFLHEYTHEEYIINEEFCKDTMRMMADFIGHVNGRMDSERKRLTEHCVVLMHDSATTRTTAEALPDIIRWYTCT